MRMKILWASPNTLLDTTNGAALMVRECLRQLALRHCSIKIFSATIFVSQEGQASFNYFQEKIVKKEKNFIDVEDGVLRHKLMLTHGSQRRLMFSYEEKIWFDNYLSLLDEDKPDIVLFFDNSLITLLTAYEARSRNIQVGVFLMHGNNSGKHWCRDVDWIFTDTRATSKMYFDREGYQVLPLGTFVNPDSVRSDKRRPENLLFINPIPAKGVVLAIQIAFWLAKHRPDIKIEIVDTRKTWLLTLQQISKVLTLKPQALHKVLVTSNTPDMKQVYGRARLLFVPSLWWESGPRVIVEALSNGIPVLGSDSGGIPEVMGSGGEVFSIPESHRCMPYLRVFSEQFVESVAVRICKYWDDERTYQQASENALKEFKKAHSLKRNGDSLKDALETCLKKLK